jgi:hypothetical protein
MAGQGRAAEDSPPEPRDLPANEKKQQFSLGYVRLVVAAAGCSVKSHETDYDGVDITIVSSSEYETFYCPEFELQLKCTSRQDILQEDRVAWPMTAKPLGKLINPKRFAPAYLGVLVVPAEPEAWLDQNEDRLISASRMYWQSAADLAMTGDSNAATRTVYLPRSNQFDVPQLRGIMKTIGDGGDA